MRRLFGDRERSASNAPGHSVDKDVRKADQIYSVDDFRALARRRLPRPIFDYLDGGADLEWTLARNVDGFADYEIIPDVLTDVSSIRTATTIFGQPAACPLMLSATGLTRMFHSSAEPAVARAAAAEGIPYCLSTMGTTRLEDLAAAVPVPMLFQIYVFKDRGLTREFVSRCRDAGYAGLCLTVDTPVAGNRLRDRRSGLSLPPRLTARSLLDFALHPGWSIPALTGARFDLANVSHRTEALATSPMSLFDFIGRQFDPGLTWRDVEWLASEWNGPLAIKGLMTPEDATRAIRSGASGVILSNHGGRQLDGAPAPIDQVAPVRDALGNGPDVICDGGVRRGSDIVKALALGATACSIGRPYLYGLAARGEAGVARTLRILRDELERTLALAGVPDIQTLARRHIRHRPQ